MTLISKIGKIASEIRYKVSSNIDMPKTTKQIFKQPLDADIIEIGTDMSQDFASNIINDKQEDKPQINIVA